MAINPYISQQASQLQTDATNNLQRRILPGINQGSIASGGFGGSRQGIAQGLAIGETNRGVADAQNNLYSNAYNTDQQIQQQQAALAAQERMASMQNQTSRDLGFGSQTLQRDLGMGQLDLGRTQASNQYSLGQGQLDLGRAQAGNQYNLGLGQLGLGAQQADQNFYTSQRGQDLQGLSLGASLAGQGNTGLSNQGQQLYNVGQTQQQAPWQNIQNYANLLSPFSGLNQTNTQSQPGGSTLGNIAGGALTAAQLWQLLNGSKP